jgi:antitoxin (DNA-binding transcriptional repressor) of toxin-antitoxin stability system
MKRYKVAMVRERLSEALDYASTGEPVFIERKGVTYRLSAEPQKQKKIAARSKIEVLDPAITRGEWSWDWSGGALKFRARR